LVNKLVISVLKTANIDVIPGTGLNVIKGFLTGLPVHFGLFVVQVLSQMDEASQ